MVLKKSKTHITDFLNQEKKEWKLKKYHNNRKILQEIDKENHLFYPEYKMKKDHTKLCKKK